MVYYAPEAEFDRALRGIDLLCTSPGNGENEDVIYEEW